MRRFLCVGTILGALLAPACARRSPDTADLLIHNARVFTLEDAQPWAQAVAIRDDRIVWVGSDENIESMRDVRTRMIDAEGRLLLPGFIDSHNHIRYGNNPDELNLQGTSTLEQIQDRVRAFALRRPDLEWITGGGWAYTAIPNEDGLPTADDLAGLADGRPMVLISYDAHTAWLNKEAMQQIGLVRDSELSRAKEVVIDASTGEPSGIVRGVVSLGDANPVLRILWEQLPAEADDGAYASLQASLLQALGYGITSIIAPQAELAGLSLFERARDDGSMRSRVEIALFHPPGTRADEIERFAEARERVSDDRLRVTAIKLYIDDVIEAHTAAMLAPYADQPDENGDTFYTPEEFDEIVTRLDAAGFQMFIHAIGDRGIRVALDSLARARQINGARDSRHQLVHIELVSPKDIPRFGELGVVACMQPRHVAPENIAQWAAAVGPARAPNAFPWRSLQEAGATLAFSSDWDVSEMDPLVGIYSALTRRSLDGEPREGWQPQESLDLESAIRAYTMGGAFANFMEEDRGSIRVGKYADLVLLSRDLFEIPEEEILDTHVVLTMVGGEIVYQAD